MGKKNIISILFMTVGIILIATGLYLNQPSENLSAKEYKEEVPREYKNITYSITKSDYCSCLTFGDNNHFYEYDCDSEPTNMPFTGEYYDTYGYSSKKNSLVFKGNDMTPVEAEIINWDKDSLQIKVLGSKQDKSCTIDGENTYQYYVNQITIAGSQVKDYISEINIEDLVIEYWNDSGRQTCNKQEEERCYSAIIITTEEILASIKEEENYLLSYFRANDGTIESILITKDR